MLGGVTAQRKSRLLRGSIEEKEDSGEAAELGGLVREGFENEIVRSTYLMGVKPGDICTWLCSHKVLFMQTKGSIKES